jgi:8-oxo-dGTP pyrophosphatase MutT (NUDIX family)
VAAAHHPEHRAATPQVDIEAAGGVVLRDSPRGVEVLVVHRVRYDDWSLPKGKLHPGEDAAGAARREVEEETGVRAAVGPELPSVTYHVGPARKRVRWFRMRPLDGDPTARPPDHEVDLARWVPLPDAARLLTYDLERRVLAPFLDDPTEAPR